MLYRWWESRYYWDEFYDRTVVRVIGIARDGFARFDAAGIDRLVNGIARGSRRPSERLRRLRPGVVRDYALVF